MISRCTEWMSGRWWAALAVLLAFILVARTGTVGAPAEARTSPGTVAAAHAPAPAPPPARRALERIDELQAELDAARRMARFERERAELLRASRDRLDGELTRLGARVRDALDAPAPLAGDQAIGALVPVPIEAVFVRDPAR